MAELTNSEFSEKAVFEQTGTKQVIGVKGLSVAERGDAKPTLDINDMVSGYTVEGPKTIFPAKATSWNRFSSNGLWATR